MLEVAFFAAILLLVGFGFRKPILVLSLHRDHMIARRVRGLGFPFRCKHRSIRGQVSAKSCSKAVPSKPRPTQAAMYMNLNSSIGSFFHLTFWILECISKGVCGACDHGSRVQG